MRFDPDFAPSGAGGRVLALHEPLAPRVLSEVWQTRESGASPAAKAFIEKEPGFHYRLLAKSHPRLGEAIGFFGYGVD